MRVFKCQPIKGTVQASILKKKKTTTVAINAFSVKSYFSLHHTLQSDASELSWFDSSCTSLVAMATHSSVLAGESLGQRSLAGCCPWGHTESTTEASSSGRT